MLLAGTDVVGHLLDYWIAGPWFTGHHALLIVVSVLMVLVFRWAARRIQTTPQRTGLLALLEVGLVFVRDDIVYPWLGDKKGRPFVPFFWTLFFFILICNLIGLVPTPVNIWHRTATGNLFVTGALAAIAFVTIQVSGMRTHGYGGYWIHLVPGGVPWFLWPIVWLIEVVGLLTKPFALMVRLFANMTAGHAIVAVLTGFMLGVAHYGSTAIGGAASLASFGFWLFMMLFETLVALIQAYIFTVLTAIFVSLAVAEEH